MYCSNCGNQLNPGEQVCSRCGNAIQPVANTNTQKPERNAPVTPAPNNGTQTNSEQPKKKKAKWWIPVIIFFTPIIIYCIRTAIILFQSPNTEMYGQAVEEGPFLKLLLNGIFPIIQLICFLAFIPSVVIVAVKANAKK